MLFGGAAAIAISIVAVLSLFVTPANATVCFDTNDHDAWQQINTGTFKGAEHDLNMPQGSALFDNNQAQELQFLGTLTQFGACGQDCQMQVGNILGTIGGPSGPDQSTDQWRPYVEEYQPGGYGSHFSIYFGLTSSPSNFYTIFRTDEQDGAGNWFYRAYFDGGYGLFEIGGAWLNGTFPVITAQSENANFQSGHICPVLTNQEWGTHGFGTYIDEDSKLYLFNWLSQWVPWEGDAADQTSQGADFPYDMGYFVFRSAFNVSGG